MSYAILLSCLIFLISILYTVASNNHAKYDRIWKKDKEKCERVDCAHIAAPEEGYNCVNECVSSKCYEEIYSASPLEDGEIDSLRSRQFSSCVRKETRANYSNRRKTK